MANTKTLNCCRHTYQNNKYEGKTLHNETKAGEWRCTVCGKVNNKEKNKK